MEDKLKMVGSGQVYDVPAKADKNPTQLERMAQALNIQDDLLRQLQDKLGGVLDYGLEKQDETIQSLPESNHITTLNEQITQNNGRIRRLMEMVVV